MYIPKHFEVEDRNEVFAFVEANSFGQLISHVNGRHFSTHMPFLLSEGRDKLIGHIAAQNPQHLELEGQEVLVTLQGEHAYVSPSWYSAPGVPTWNYQALHIYGQASVFTSSEKLQAVVDALTKKYESVLPQPWQPAYNPSMLSAIIGIEITIDDIECKYKLSQNRSEQDRSQVISQLKSQGRTELAKAMERNEL